MRSRPIRQAGVRSRHLPRSPATLLGCVLLGRSAAPARAELTARELLQAFQEIEAHGRVEGLRVDLPDTARAGLCFGYFSAILGATLFSNADNTRVLGICTPERENSHQMARVVARFVETNPQYADNRAIAMVLSALKQAYACPASQEPTRGRCSRGHHRYIRGAERPVRTGSQTLLRRTQGERVSSRVLPIAAPQRNAPNGKQSGCRSTRGEHPPAWPAPPGSLPPVT
jgi:hypothetical protein